MYVLEIVIVTAIVGAAAAWVAVRVWRFFARTEAAPCLGCNGACVPRNHTPRTNIVWRTANVNQGRGQYGRAIER